MAIAKRFEEVDFTLDIFGVLVDIGPGSYTVVLPEDLGSMYLSDYVANHKGKFSRNVMIIIGSIVMSTNITIMKRICRISRRK